MKAIVSEAYGSPDVMKLKEVDKPVPKENEVLISVRAASVNAADWRLLRGEPFLVRLMYGVFKPRIRTLGADVAGVVEVAGSKVKRFKPGDEVFGDLSGCGFGGFAEYATASENALAIKPSDVSFEEAAALPMAAVTALQGLRDKGEIRAGQKVLINGASGGVGAFALQLAKYFGAETTAVCSASKMEQAKSLGADHVIDYAREDFTQNGKKYDLIVGVNGYHPIRAYKRSLTSRGVYIMIGGGSAQIFEALLLGPLMSRKSGKKLTSLTVKPNPADLEFVVEALRSGKLKPVIEKNYPLPETPEALRYAEKGSPRGKLIITV